MILDYVIVKNQSLRTKALARSFKNCLVIEFALFYIRLCEGALNVAPVLTSTGKVARTQV
jgi:hypothetical protein